MRKQSCAYCRYSSDFNTVASCREVTAFDGTLFWNNFVSGTHGTSYFAKIYWADVGGTRPMSTADDYRRYAADCMALAGRLTDPADKSRLAQMAQAFLDLAEKREKLDPQPKGG